MVPQWPAKDPLIGSYQKHIFVAHMIIAFNNLQQAYAKDSYHCYQYVAVVCGASKYQLLEDVSTILGCGLQINAVYNS